MSYVCEICGRITDKAYVVLIDGAEFIVCENCKRYGKLVKVLGENKAKFKKKEHKRAETRLKRSPESIFEDELLLVPDYGEIIRKEREKRKMSITELAKKLGISESYLRRIENQKIIPDEKTVAKIEEFFGISLRTKDLLVDIKVSEQEIDYTPTLGDFVQLENEGKKKKK